MMRVKYNVDEFLKDILSEDGHFVEFLSCNEYAVWYLIRYLKITSSLPALGTKAFLTGSALEKQTTFGCFDKENVEQLLMNLEKEFNCVVVSLDEKMDLNLFIQKAIKQGNIIYTYYDHFYNSFYEDITVHDYHGHIVTGYDEDECIYYGLFGNEYKVRFSDLENMKNHCLEQEKTLRNRFFYLIPGMGGLKNPDDHLSVKEKVIKDLEAVTNAWQKEIDMFCDYVKRLPSIYERKGSEKDQFLLEQRLLFNSIMEGLHHNMIFRFRIIYEIFHYDTSELEAVFKENRRKGMIIANMFRKLYIYTREYYEGEKRYLKKIMDKIESVFVRESAVIMEQTKNVIMEVRETHEN